MDLCQWAFHKESAQIYRMIIDLLELSAPLKLAKYLNWRLQVVLKIPPVTLACTSVNLMSPFSFSGSHLPYDYGGQYVCSGVWLNRRYIIARISTVSLVTGGGAVTQL